MEIDNALLTRAVEAIVRYESKKSASKNANALFEEYDKPILLSIQLTTPVTKTVDRPVRVKIPHSLYAEDGSNSLCMFCRTEDKAEFEKLMNDKSIPGLTSVISMKEVKRDYKAINDRKKLLTSHTHFLCDPSIMTQLYNSLGNTFSKRNKYPVPIKKYKSFDKVPSRAMDALASTYMHLRGEVISVRMAHTGMSVREIVDNFTSGITSACEKLPDEWRSVHSLHIKSADSAALPIYSKAKNDYVAYAKGLGGVEDKPKGKKGKAPPAAPAVAASTKTPGKAAQKKAATPAPAAQPEAQPAPAPVASAKKKVATPAKATPAKATPVKATPAKAATPAAAPEEVPAAKSKATPAKAAQKKAATPAPEPEAEPVKAASAAKKTPKAKAAAPEPAEEEMATPMSAKKAKKTPSKKAAEEASSESDTSETSATRRSTRKAPASKRAAVLEPVPEDKEVVLPKSAKKRPAAAMDAVPEDDESRSLRRGRSASR